MKPIRMLLGGGLLLAMVAVTAFPAAGAELDTLIGRDNLWELTGAEIARAYPQTFQWMDSSRSRLRYNAVTMRAPMTLFNQNVQEVVFDFKADRLENFTVSIYNRGDAGELERRSFQNLLTALTRSGGEYMGLARPTDNQSAAVGSSRIRAAIWKNSKADLVLRSSYTRDTPEYVTLDFYRPGQSPRNLRDGMRVTVSSADLGDNVQTGPDGSKFIPMPMVDQGAKGYCVGATVERVLKYYGSEIDQHVIAQLAASDAARGTSMTNLIKALEGNQSKLGIRFRQLYEYAGIDDFYGFQNMIDQYNSAARSMKKPNLNFWDYVFTIDDMRYLDYGTLMNSLDFAVFRQMRQKERNGVRNFMAAVKSSIDEGVPLCWSTFIFPGVGDSTASEFGMHMRIINGYNPVTNAVIYTDSWGMQHEKKLLSAEDAFGITVHLVSLAPRNRRMSK